MKSAKIKSLKSKKVPIAFNDDELNSDSENESCKVKNTPNNVLHYSLSDKQYINMGWTVLPKHKFMKKEKIFIPVEQKKEKDWVNNTPGKTVLAYKSGELLAEFKKKSMSKIYYKDGRTAVDINKCEMNGHKYLRYILRNDENDALLAIFDTLGRGVVTDETGKTRIKFNQIEGVLLDPSVGTPRTWKWHYDADKPEFENVMFDTFLQPPDDSIAKMIEQETSDSHGEQASARGEVSSRLDNSTSRSCTNECKQHPKKSNLKKSATAEDAKPKKDELRRENTKLSMVTNVGVLKNTRVFRHQQLKPMTIKINNYLTLKIISRKNMYVTFLHDCWLLKIDLGVELTNECLESYLIDPEFASTDYEIVLSKVNKVLNKKSKSKKVDKTKKIHTNAKKKCHNKETASKTKAHKK